MTPTPSLIRSALLNGQDMLDELLSILRESKKPVHTHILFCLRESKRAVETALARLDGLDALLDPTA